MTGTNPAEPQGPVAPVIKWVPREEDHATNNKIVLTHIAFKGFPSLRVCHVQHLWLGAEAGSIIASVIQTAIYRTRLKNALPQFFVGNLVVTAASAVLTTSAGYYILNTSEPIRNFDRAFRYLNPFSFKSHVFWIATDLIALRITRHKIAVTSTLSCLAVAVF